MIITYRTLDTDAAGRPTGQSADYHRAAVGHEAVTTLRAIQMYDSLELVRIQLTVTDLADPWSVRIAVTIAAQEGCPVRNQWVRTTDVRAGDELAHKLSDTPWTYTPVTGWSDRLLAGCGAHGTDVTHRTFAVTGAPWWVREEDCDTVSDLDGETLIRLRAEYLPGGPA